ncbi:MAG: hypothetical protein CVU65_08425 [Deltaproteobacteria bacterium HGW-Deltaproteobacteria-22]|nr:MAG: hypothetical protein CVU65_08425 [Deltaproteobacteria bacterium HGW-Deltaproteobacteria-22]
MRWRRTPCRRRRPRECRWRRPPSQGSRARRRPASAACGPDTHNEPGCPARDPRTGSPASLWRSRAGRPPSARCGRSGAASPR